MATHSSVLAWDGDAWWAVVYGVTQSRTRLKWLSSSSSSNLLIHKNLKPATMCKSRFSDRKKGTKWPFLQGIQSLDGRQSPHRREHWQGRWAYRIGFTICIFRLCRYWSSPMATFLCWLFRHYLNFFKPVRDINMIIIHVHIRCEHSQDHLQLKTWQ